MVIVVVVVIIIVFIMITIMVVVEHNFVCFFCEVLMAIAGCYYAPGTHNTTVVAAARQQHGWQQ